MTTTNQSERTKKMVQMAMLAAISIVLVLLVHFPLIPAAPWLEYDMADIPVLLGAFLLGPIPGLIILLVASVIQAFLLGGNGIIGLIMHFVASGALIVVASLVYKACKETTKGLVIGLVAGSLVMAALMMPMNLIFTPILFGVSTDFVKSMMLSVLLPFNLIKAGLNSVIFFILFKGLRLVLNKKAH